MEGDKRVVDLELVECQVDIESQARDVAAETGFEAENALGLEVGVEACGAVRPIAQLGSGGGLEGGSDMGVDTRERR